jgi:hypothetical protein
VQKIYFFSHLKYLFCLPFDSAARSSRTTPTHYAPSYMDVTVFWLVTPCIYQTLRHLLERQSSEAHEVTEHSKTILDIKIYHCVT